MKIIKENIFRKQGNSGRQEQPKTEIMKEDMAAVDKNNLE